MVIHQDTRCSYRRKYSWWSDPPWLDARCFHLLWNCAQDTRVQQPRALLRVIIRTSPRTRKIFIIYLLLKVLRNKNQASGWVWAEADGCWVSGRQPSEPQSCVSLRTDQAEINREGGGGGGASGIIDAVDTKDRTEAEWWLYWNMKYLHGHAWKALHLRKLR